MKVGFIGLGIMGKPMCRNLMKAGYEAVVYNRSKASVEELAAEGAQAAGSPAEVAENCQVIITMLPNSPQVREVCLGENGIASAAKEGTIVIDMSSIDPVQSKEIGAELNKKGIDLMDAPVSGGEPKAIDGTISVMVGGSKENFDKYYDLLMAMAGSVVYVGELGSGNVAKLANQVIVALNIAAVSEALTLAVKNDADPELVYKAIRGGLAGSTVLDAKAPMMMAHNFKPGFRIELHIKDLNNALNAGHAVNAGSLKNPACQCCAGHRWQSDRCGRRTVSASCKPSAGPYRRPMRRPAAHFSFQCESACVPVKAGWSAQDRRPRWIPSPVP